MQNYESPLDLLRKNIGEGIYVRMRNKTEVEGKLIGYDEHLNMMIDEASVRKQDSKQMRNLLYLRGDTIVLVARR